MKMRKIIAILAAVLMLCSLLPVSAFAAAGDVALNKDFNDGNAFFERGYVEDGYMVFDATTDDWQCAYQSVNGIKANTLYKVTFKAKANKDAKLNFKINNNWSGDTVKEVVEVTTEWQNYELIVNSGDLQAAIVMFSSPDYAVNAAIYYIDDVKIVETVDPALIGKVVNGDFSDNSGWKLGNGASIANGVLTLTNIGAWSEAAMQTVPVKANTNYEISWKSQYVSGSGVTNMILMDASLTNYKLTSGQNWMNSTSTGWVDHTVTLNTGDHESIVFKLTSESGGSKVINIDNIKIAEVKDPSFDGYVYNGDFETGKTSSWTNLWGSSTLEIVEGRDGGYAVKGTASGSYNITYQEVAVTPNTNYTVWAYSKNSSNSALWIKNAGGNGDIKNASFNSASDWALTSVSFNSGSNSSVWIGLMGIAAGGTYTVDDIFMFEAQPETNDGYIKNGNFETGAVSPWENLWSSCPTVEIVKGGKDSNFALHIVSGEWKHVRQTAIAVEANTDYKITVWGKNVKGMTLLVKDGSDTTDIIKPGVEAGDEWTEFTVEFNSGEFTSIIFSLMGNNGENAYGTFDNIKMEKVCVHEYDSDCDADCNLCGETREPAHKYSSDCDNTCNKCDELTRPNAPAAHEYRNACDGNCMNCYEETNPGAAHKLVHVEAKEPVDCQTAGNIEYWTCEYCNACWLDANGRYFTNAMRVRRYGDCVSDSPACVDGACKYCTLPVAATEDHAYAYACDAHCMNCFELTNPDAAHTMTYVEAKAATCTENGNIAYYTCEHCGGCWDNENATGMPLNKRMIVIPAACTYDDNCDSTCNICGEERQAPHTLTYVEAKVPTNCQEIGHDEYWECADCGACFGDAEASSQINPAWMYYTGEHVRPEGSIVCAVVKCEVCGEDSYGESCDRGDAPVCQDAPCVNCGEICFGWGCNYNTGDEEVPLPLCQPGDCVYCGTHYEKLYDCENGSWAPCSEDGECSYGCGKQYPATGKHEVDDPCAGGLCWLCWNEIEPVHEYFYPCDATCMNCYELTNPDAAHTMTYVEAKAATCTANGNIAYYTCEHCGGCWDNEAGTGMPLNKKMVVTPMAEHTYFYPCDANCMVCYELTNPDAAHTMTYVEAKAATCTENGNIAYYTCEHCGGCWDNANATGMPLNKRMIVIPAAGEHSYDDDFDVDCNNCGETREINMEVYTFAGTSVAEEKTALGFGFTLKAGNVVVENGNEFVSATIVPFTNGVEYKLVRMGAVVANINGAELTLDAVNGATIKDVVAKRLYSYDAENGELTYAIRIINIPNVGKNQTITMRPYYIYEKDGVEVVVYEDAASSSYTEAKAAADN